MNKNTTLKLTIGIFTVVAILHLLRFLLDWNLIIESYSFPNWGSLIAAIILGFLAFNF